MEYKYLSSVPKPLLNDFVNSRVIPFVGAGFSKNAEIPKGLTMPDWNGLGECAAREIPDYEYDNNALNALSYYEELYTRPKLVELLMKELHHGEIHPGSTHEAFCNLFTGTICTTNFDLLIEEEMTLLSRPVSVVATSDRLTVGSRDENKIIKLHGDFNHPERMVITEHDYDVYLEKNPIFATYIANLFITNTMLLIGYSLDDDDFRGIWQVVNSRLGSMAQPAYCITVNASPEKVARYQRRNIKVINLKGEDQDYKTILRDFFIELKDYIDSERDKEVKSIDEKINEQMIIPAENNKLCFISCIMSRISLLSELLYPTLYDMGITPVRIDDMLMPSDNWVDVSWTAIRKSKAAIVDVSDISPNVMLELQLIMSARSEDNLLIICEEGRPIPTFLQNNSILKYTLQYTFNFAGEEGGVNGFIKAVKEWCSNVYKIDAKKSYSNNQESFADAKRLFEKGEYSASIISAYAELEELLVQKMPPNVRLTNFAYQFYFNFFDDNDKDTEMIFALRNCIVHERYVASKKEAQSYLKKAKHMYVNICKKMPQ